MYERYIRKFTLGDAMILVASTALAALAIRATLPAPFVFARQFLTTPGVRMRAFVAIRYGLSALIPILAALTSAVVAIRLRWPRPRLRRVARQPGTVACTIATMAAALEAGWIGGLLAVGSPLISPATVFVVLVNPVGFAVAAAWTALSMAGQWRPEIDWVDRVGRLCGAAWIGVAVVSDCCYFLIY
ncbi:MAG: hypothetical protein JWN86_4292 [Planctomycetota bacterium]|nr:hypothetical protein [Planctomycetota bacterium]